jgi:hypothetical protein
MAPNEGAMDHGSTSSCKLNSQSTCGKVVSLNWLPLVIFVGFVSQFLSQLTGPVLVNWYCTDCTLLLWLVFEFYLFIYYYFK